VASHGQTSSTHIDAAAKNTGKYSEEEGFMRGARIAEKIQEYYHTNSNMGISATN